MVFYRTRVKTRLSSEAMTLTMTNRGNARQLIGALSTWTSNLRILSKSTFLCQAEGLYIFILLFELSSAQGSLTTGNPHLRFISVLVQHVHNFSCIHVLWPQGHRHSRHFAISLTRLRLRHAVAIWHNDFSSAFTLIVFNPPSTCGRRRSAQSGHFSLSPRYPHTIPSLE